ncbi:MAG: indolepyruvate ferredoxin oxidoreductase subunit alpha [Clostridiales bacterium]|nr:indolepyruvate ferredoxin oxidoreductase subunit alpha [Clostridiales bacterium]
MKQLLMGNEIMALGALRAGVGLVCGYPGTPSTEVLETIAKKKSKGEIQNVYVEWSVNEKSAMEVAAGAAYSGVRCLVTMKQVGLNVASDPLMSLEYVGIKGGMVILVADDPGPISSQTEQDTRKFGEFSKVPVFDPSCPEEAYLMMADAFELSEKTGSPVFFRPTTRICHATASIELLPDLPKKKPEGFIKDSSRWVIFPRTSFLNHKKIEERNEKLRTELSSYKYNEITGGGKKGIAAGGVSVAYAKEALNIIGGECRMFKVATPFPFPEKKALEFLDGLDEVLCYEELDPVIEKELTYICGKYNLNIKIKGKLSGDTPNAGENGVEAAEEIFAKFLGLPTPEKIEQPDIPLPVRPPTLCAGCPHRASFYAVKLAIKGRKAVFAGDIGCYTLGNAMPLDMTDTCLCMGAGITIAQGINRAEPDTVCFSFTGDSTFFHTGLAGIANAVYNDAHMVAVILDNSTTAMTGHQPNPGTGKSAIGEVAEKIDIEGVLHALGVKSVYTADPLKLPEAVETVKKAADARGVSAIIFRSPCIAIVKPLPLLTVNNEKCVGCKKCIKELGCPAIVKDGKKVKIDSTLCYGCGLCAYVCPTNAINVKEENQNA